MRKLVLVAMHIQKQGRVSIKTSEKGGEVEVLRLVGGLEDTQFVFGKIIKKILVLAFS